MEASAHTQSFEDAIAITCTSPNFYTANLDPSWAIGDVPHGGYLAAILNRLARHHFTVTHKTRHQGHPTSISMQVAFVRRCATGLAKFNVEDIKIGSRTSTIRVTLSQQDAFGRELVKLMGFIIVSNMANEQGLTVASDWTVPSPSRPHPHCSPREHKRDNALSVPWRRFSVPYPEFRKATTHVQIYVRNGPESSMRHGLVDQWAVLGWTDKDGREVRGRWTNEAATFLLDIFPATLGKLEQEALTDEPMPVPIWFPTLSLNIDYKKELPEDGVEWLYSRISMKSVKNGRTDIEVVLMDELGELVAVATHAGLVMSSKRNRAKF